MEAVLSTTRRHSSSLATPSHPMAIRRAARMPKGVAALPSPSRLQEMLALMAFSVSRSRQARGSSRRRTGRNRREMASMKPHLFMIAMIPVHRHRIPPMEIQSSTAAVAPSRAALETSAMVPLTTPNTRESTTIPVQTHAIAIARITSPHSMWARPGSYKNFSYYAQT